MKIIFIQLPLTDHSRGYINANVPYAPAVISGFISRNYKEHYCETLPEIISSHCSDEVIANYVVNSDFDIVAFTTYLWNMERNLAIASQLKKQIRSVKIYFGGPEISEGSSVFSEERPSVDAFVSGEGEWFFSGLFEGTLGSPDFISGNALYRQPLAELVSPDMIVEPLTSGFLNIMSDGSTFMEMTRGCPYRCSYCFYSKNYSTVRNLSFTYLTEVLSKQKGIEEIYLLSPAFDRSPGFIEKLNELKRINPGVKLHTEIRTDRIDSATAGLMKDAGFASLEVGLQSLNKLSLENVCRNSDPDAEIRGMTYLRDAGIDLKIGIIPGLPGDTPESFISTVDTLDRMGFADFIELYPLMILPGTAIREKAKKEGISFLNNPPYFYNEGWGFTFSDMININSYVEEITGMSHNPDYLPDFTCPQDPLFIRGIRFNSDKGGFNPAIIKSRVHTHVADIHINFTSSELFYKVLADIIQNAPQSRLYNIIINSDIIIDEIRITKMITSTERDNFYRRLHIHSDYNMGSLFRFFQIFSSLNSYIKGENVYSIMRPVLIIDDKKIRGLESINPEEACILVKQGCYEKNRDFLVTGFMDYPNSVAFENESEMAQFYSDCRIEFTSFPYSFGIIDL